MNPAPPPAPAALSPVERYHILRDQVQHEDNLITQRLSWLVASQSFLFTAYAIILNGPERIVNSFVATQRQWLLTAVPALALAASSLIYVSILAGVCALAHLHRHARRVCDQEAAHLAFPPIQGTTVTRWAGLTSPVLIPPLFAAVWLFLMIRGIVR